MKTTSQLFAVTALLALLLPALGGCSCGFDCNNDSSKQTTTLSLGFSDESVEQLKQVVIEVDSITFRRTGSEDVVVDTFTIAEQGLVEADTFQIDLLNYRGLNQLLVITGLELDSATYSSLLVRILGGDVNRSYVQESDDSLKPLSVAGGVLTLPGPVLPAGEQVFTVAFSLAQALRFQAASTDYLLTTDGIRVMDDGIAASLSGRVDPGLFNSVAPCDGKTDPESGNRIYLYEGSAIPVADLADVFNSGSTTAVPAKSRAPYAVAAMARDTLTGGWQYSFGYIDAGDYTLGFSCAAADDDPVNYNGIVIPLPTDEAYDIQLTEGESGVCDLTETTSC